MRHVSFTVPALLLALVGLVAAQDRIQSGIIKSADPASGRITITVDGRDIDVIVTDRTMFRTADNQPLTTFRQQGLPAGTPVMFRTESQDGRLVLWGLRLGGQGNPGAGRPQAPPAPQPRASIGAKPLTEVGDEGYKQQSGGLYGQGRNSPPEQHQLAADRAAARIQPLDESGRPSPGGKVVLLAIGMSNTTQEFSAFKALADRDPRKSPQLVVVDGAQGGQAAEQWTDPGSAAGAKVWDTVDARLKTAGVTPQQVQVVWIKQALIAQGRFGEFPAHAQKLQSDLTKILQISRRHFPQLQLAYLSSRIYAGYATTNLNPEPYAYEGAFSVRWVIDAQIQGDPALNFDAARGAVRAPVVLWGPYLWADGTTPRKQDGLVWNRDDLVERDGTHPSDSGRQKVAELLLNFFHSDGTAQRWYLKSGAAAAR